MAMGRAGTVVVGWTEAGSPSAVRVAVRAADAAGFAPTETVATGHDALIASVAAGDGETVAVGWWAGDAPATPGRPVRAVDGRSWVARRGIGDGGWTQPTSPGIVPPALAVDADGAVLAAWMDPTSLPTTVTARAAVLEAAATAWVASPALGTQDPVDPAATISQVAMSAGRAMVHWSSHNGPGDDSTELWIREPDGAWTSRRISIAHPWDRVNEGASFAQSPSGHALVMGPGFLVRNLDALPTPPGARVIHPVAHPRGSDAVIRLRLSLPALVTVSAARSMTSPAIRTRRTRLGAGRRTLRLGPLRRGRYVILVTACHWARGCTPLPIITEAIIR